MANFFKYDDATHTYKLDGITMPSVTQIMSPLHDFSFVSPEVLDQKRIIGTLVHKTIHLYLSGNLPLESATLSSGNKLALDLFKEWYTSSTTKELLGDLYFSEMPMYHRDKLYGVTPDLVFEKGVVEIKTRYPDFKKDSIQTAAQASAARSLMPETLGVTLKECYVLGINFKDGKYRFSDVNSIDGEAIFDKLHERYKREAEFSEYLTKLSKRTKKECQNNGQ